MRVLLVVLALAAPAIAGCVQDDPRPDGPGEGPIADPGWSTRALAYGGAHDHADPAQHRDITTPNFELLGYDPLLSPDYGGTTPAGYLCGDAKKVQDGRRLAVVESRSDVAFAVADVTDAARPKWLGELVMRRTHIYDVAVVPDGKHVVAVTSGFDNPQQGPLLPVGSPDLEWRTPCGATVTLSTVDPIPRPPSTLLISIEDPANPRVIDQQPVQGFGHSIFSTILEGRRWVTVASVLTGATDSFDFYELVDTPLGARLNRLTTYTTTLADEPGTNVGGHSEVEVHKHPVLGKVVAYVQSRDAVRLLDMTDPRQPKLLGTWTDVRPGREGFSGALHSIYMLPELRDGRHYVVIGPEWVGHPDGTPSGVVWIVDDTDPAKMKEVAVWTLPHEVEWTGRLMFSNHYLSVVGNTLFVSMYHGGVWAVDLTDLGDGSSVKLLPSIGVFAPTNVSPKPPSTPIRWTPTNEEVLALDDGSLVTFDSNSGLYTFRFDASRPMTPPAPWPIPTLT